MPKIKLEDVREGMTLYCTNETRGNCFPPGTPCVVEATQAGRLFIRCAANFPHFLDDEIREEGGNLLDFEVREEAKSDIDKLTLKVEMDDETNRLVETLKGAAHNPEPSDELLRQWAQRRQADMANLERMLDQPMPGTFIRTDAPTVRLMRDACRDQASRLRTADMYSLANSYHSLADFLEKTLDDMETDLRNLTEGN